MVREFSLLNEKNQMFSLMDIENYCLLTEPTGLGMTYESEYEQLQNIFITNLRKLSQGSISATLNFKGYDNYRSFIDFVEGADRLKILYKVPYKNGVKEYFRDVNIDIITKTEISYETGLISESVTLNCLSLWYEEMNTVYTIEPESDEIRWNFTWDSKFVGYDTRNLDFLNEGHVDASIELEIDGDVENPVLKLYVENELYQTVTITNHITEHQILKYGTRENNFYIKKQLANGTEQNLFNLSYIDFDEDLVIRFPKGKPCTFKMEADNDITSARLTIYVYYKAV